MEAVCFFCSDFGESGAMQIMALFLNLARKRILVEILTEHQELWSGRPFTESTTIGRDRDAHGGGEWRWGNSSRDTSLDAIPAIHN